ncbi:MAG TPA: ABC transporter substrate-binding protein [Candidatus Binatia bacterium]|nr:ABC transporter substrate-binding protein [Candidatus Binatia bacterium]
MKQILFAAVAGLALALSVMSPRLALAQKLTIGWSAVSALNAPFWVMKDAGFLKREGLDANLVYIPSSSTMAQAQISGDVQISTANSQVIVDADLKGGDLVAIGAVTNAVAFYVMANPAISSVADLRGKRVGVTRFGASTDFAMRTLLEKHNLKPISEVPIVQIGGMPEIAAALSNGAIAAAPMSYPMAYVAQQNGVKLLANMAQEGIAFVHVGLTTSRGFLDQHRSQAKAFLRAYGRAVHYMHTDKEGFKKIISRYSKISDPGMLQGTIQYAYDFVEKVPLVERKAFQNTIDEIAERRPEAKQAKPEQFYDNELVQELEKEGFFSSLWGKDVAETVPRR